MQRNHWKACVCQECHHAFFTFHIILISKFAVQLGAFANAADATALRDRARAAGFSATTETVKTDKGMLTRVRLGPVGSRESADSLRSQAQSKLGIGGVVRPQP